MSGNDPNSARAHGIDDLEHAPRGGFQGGNDAILAAFLAHFQNHYAAGESLFDFYGSDAMRGDMADVVLVPIVVVQLQL